MGLGIQSFSSVKFVQAHNPDSEPEDDNLHLLIAVDDFMAQTDGLQTGWYEVNGEHGHYHVGSYSSYNAWRNTLSRLSLGLRAEEIWRSPESFEGKPFVELINFSDCEGFIGPETSAKLAADFVRHRAEIATKEAQAYALSPVAPSPSWFMEIYDQFMAAFLRASHTGVVKFS